MIKLLVVLWIFVFSIISYGIGVNSKKEYLAKYNSISQNKKERDFFKNKYLIEKFNKTLND